MTKPNYYATITAEVRYSKKITPNAKLLYAEITALSSKDGVCWASNKYFSNLYEVSTVTISRWVSSLVENGFINREMIYKKGTKEIDKRYLQLCNGGINKNVNAPINKNVKDNNTSINNTSINISNRRRDFVLNVMSFDYDKNILNSFVDYWTEPNKSKTKMKFELQQTWSTNLRLKNWVKNQKKWDKPKIVNKNKLTKNTETMQNVLNKLNGYD
jgi:hypothetical protein|tara:strand:- start:1388 stop:2032 length:645 start_codon:yes stop_codon:yes gene_type:complete